jgi:hypothetical protein
LQKDSGSDVTNYDVSVKSSDTSWGVLYAPLLVGKTAIGGKMDRLVVPQNRKKACRFHRRTGMRLLVALICCGLTAAAQNSTQQETSKPFSIRATHLMGFESAKSNCTGTLSIQDDSLQFQQTGKTSAHINIGSVRDVFLGEESRQVGGLPLTLSKAAAPYGGGRVVSLFSHKKYDILTLEYVDSDGGIHGAIFQLDKGQGGIVKQKLTAPGETVSSRNDQSTKHSAAEVRYENK